LEAQQKLMNMIGKSNSPIIKRLSQTKYRRYKKNLNNSPIKSALMDSNSKKKVTWDSDNLSKPG
jgi:hypothetical protein